MKKIIELNHIHKEFKNKENTVCAIKDISMEINEGEIVGIVGMSGCGKSTLLNIISGLDKDFSGTVSYFIENPKIAYMLQNDALLSFRTILDNATLGLELLKEKDNFRVTKTKNMLEAYGLKDFINKYPRELSGGMRQRVALVRSLAISPNILLLDEPFSALDYCTRLSVSEDVIKSLKKVNTSAILITHDIQEACSLCDKIIVLSNRPCTIKNIYNVDFAKLDIKEKRTLPEFQVMTNKIWEDLVNEEI